MMIACAKPTGQEFRRRFGFSALTLLGVVAWLAAAGIWLVGAAPLHAADRGAVLVAKNSSRSAESSAQLKKLIAQLGDEVFAVREEATNRLIRSGIEAKPMLMSALASPDAEVRARAKRILEIVVEGDFQRRLKAFADDVDGTLGLSMPGWDAFKELVGGDRAARAMFVEMQQSEPMLLEAYENGAEAASRVLSERLRGMQNVAGRVINQRGQRMFISQIAVQPSLGSSMSLLLVASDDSIDIKPEVDDLIRSAITPSEVRSTLMGSDERSQVCKKVVGRWVTREVGDSATQYNLETALRYNLPEGLVPAVRVLEQAGEGDNQAKRILLGRAVLAVGNFGDRSHLPLIERFFDDETEVYTTIPVARAGVAVRAAPSNRVLAQTQLRDMALAAAIKLSGEDPTELGFDLLKLPASKQLPFESTQTRYGFRNDEDRKVVFQNWEKRQTEQLQTAEKSSKKTAEKKPEKDTVER